MFISNMEGTNIKCYKCGKVVGRYLINKKVPLLSSNDDCMMFAFTERLIEAMKEMPAYMKIMIKAGVIYG